MIQPALSPGIHVQTLSLDRATELAGIHTIVLASLIVEAWCDLGIMHTGFRDGRQEGGFIYPLILGLMALSS